MNEFELPVETPVLNTTPGEPDTICLIPTPTSPSVDPIRSAAGRLGGKRVHQLAELGRAYEREHGLTPGRQRQRQLVQLGRRYETENGLRIARPRRKRTGDAWQEFLTALARVVKPAHRPAIERLIESMRPGVKGIADGTGTPDRAA